MTEMFVRRIRALSKPLQPIPAGVSPVLNPIPGVKAVLFDVYGTLVVSGSGDIGVVGAEGKAGALIDTLEEMGIRVTPQAGAEYWARFEDWIRASHRDSKDEGIEFPEVRILDVWQNWKRDTGLPIDVPKFAVDVECRMNPVWPMPGSAQIFHRLKEWGIELGIVSNAQVFTPSIFPALLNKTLEELGVRHTDCAWSWQYKSAKPGTDLYQIAADAMFERYNIQLHECLMVGNDMRNDVAPAAKLGMKTALFAGDQRSLRLREGDPMCEGIQPDVVLTELSQLENVIAG